MARGFVLCLLIPTPFFLYTRIAHKSDFDFFGFYLLAFTVIGTGIGGLMLAIYTASNFKRIAPLPRILGLLPMAVLLLMIGYIIVNEFGHRLKPWYEWF